uniref:Uncharacterized protein n=1 Tax=Anguilla anguilla TaxID=7936 RepID=A0A0E9RJJ7_ANGAN
MLIRMIFIQNISTSVHPIHRLFHLLVRWHF